MTSPVPQIDASDRFDIAIVGAGPVGCLQALMLGRAGFSVLLSDRQAPNPTASPDNRTAAIDPAGKAILADVGVWPQLAEDACAISAMKVYGKPPLGADRSGFSPFGALDLEAPLARRAPDERRTPLAHMVSNRAMHRALLEAVEAEPAITTDFTRAFEGVTSGTGELILSNATARLVIAADGIRSAVRKAANISSTTRDYDQRALTSVVTHPQPHHGVAYQRFDSGGPIALLPLNDGPDGSHRSSLVWSDQADLVTAWLTQSTDALAKRISARLDADVGEITFAETPRAFPLSAHVANRFFAPRIALVGEAAHHIHPLAGQGLNLGLRDVKALTQALISARAVGGDIGGEIVLSGYDEARRTEALRLFAVTDGLNALFQAPKPIQHLARLGMTLVNESPLRQLIAREMTRS